MSFFFHPFISFKPDTTPKPIQKIPLSNLTGTTTVFDNETYKVAHCVHSQGTNYTAFSNSTYLSYGYYDPVTGFVTTSANINYVDGSNIAGEFLNLELPWPSKISSATMYQAVPGQDARTPRQWVIAGSPNGIEWYNLGGCNECPFYGNLVPIKTTTNSNIPVRFLKYIVSRNYGELGTYWTYLSYQGTKERLTPLGKMYPSASLSNTTTLPEGTYTCTQSSYTNGPFVTAFYWDDSRAANTQFTYNGLGICTSGVTTTLVDNTVVSGEWYQITIPKAIQLQHVAIKNPFGNIVIQTAMRKLCIVGSNDGSTWYPLYRKDNISYIGRDLSFRIDVNAGDAYSTYRFIIEKIYGDSVWGNPDSYQYNVIGQVRLYSYERE